jgi:hypothetical protein
MDAEAYADMLPWLVFVVTDRKMGLSVAWAAGGALACSVGLAAWSYWRGRFALVPRVGSCVFGLFLMSALIFPSWDEQVSLPRALAVLTLCLLSFGSLRFTPLSESYTVPLVAPAVREDPRFHKVNVDMTLAWGVGSLAVALASGTTALLSGRVAFTLLDWVTPLVLATITILWAARRWELFRLSVDSVTSGHPAGGATTELRLGRRDLAGSATLRAVPNQPPAQVELSSSPDQAEPSPDSGRDAVVRQLHVRRRNVGAAGAE